MILRRSLLLLTILSVSVTLRAQSLDHLWDAISRDDSASMRSTLAATPELLNQANDEGWTALHQAAYSGKVKAISYLLAHGAKVETADPDGEHALSLAASNGRGEAVKLLLANKANANALNELGQSA